MIQKKVKERNVLKWYDSLSEEHQELHDMYESQMSFFRDSGKRWVCISKNDMSTGEKEMKCHENIWYIFFDDEKGVSDNIDSRNGEFFAA